jgi:threonyl-tRNA synthetase
MPEERYEDSHLYRLRHSLAHIMAQAVLERFPEAKIAIGPPIEEGFYYDFDLPQALADDDLKAIEKRMKKIAGGNHAFTMREITPEEGRELFADQPYKLELIDDLVQGRVDENGETIADPAEKLTIYTQDGFTDLCRGPHVETSKAINPKAFSITHRQPAGAYWRGDEKRQQLTRIYGTAFETPEELKDYLHRLEEAKKRDHRVLGEKLGLFIIDPLVGKGLPLWLPDGATLRDTLERWLRGLLLENGYEPVVTPHIGSIHLYETSGHYPYYSDSQYSPIDVDGEKFMMKPMNCPHHIMMFKHGLRSYRELPIRYAEFGTVYRYEKSGELHGLTRARGFTQDDAHLFVTDEQLDAEFKHVVRLAQHVFAVLGMGEFRARVGVRDPQSTKYVGKDEAWEIATSAIIAACDEMRLKYTIEEGDAAFYGPKLDFVFRDALKREWQLGTVQVDYNLPERFELEYITADNERKRPVMIHRALFGSVERFVGILIEHFGGEFPLWLAPTQGMIIPISQEHNEAGEALRRRLLATGMRVKIDVRDKNMRTKIRDHRKTGVPYLLLIGDQDIADGTVSVRLRTDEDKGAIPVDDFIAMAQDLINTQSLDIFKEAVT